MSNQETNQEQIQFPAQQELKHLRTRCGKVYALGNNRFRAVVQTTPVHEYDAATRQWVELSAEKRQQMAAQAQSPIATFADNSADSAAGILDTYVKEGSQQNFSHDERLWISNTNYYGNRLTYLKVVDLPRLGANHFITSAKLCVRNVYAPTADTAIMCKEVLKDWDPETITYDHQPDVSGVYQDYCRVLKNQYSWKKFDVTSLARKWYLGDNHGVQLSAPKSESSFSQLHSSETANQPYFVLEYASLAGLESYLTYDHQSAGLAGTGSVSLVNGNLIFAHADTAMNGNRLPVSVTHYYNSCDSDKDEFGMGYGWRTSLHQMLHKVLYNGEVEFVYTDGDGTEHFFKKNKDDQKKYSDQSGLSLTLEVGDENITITDKGDNVMTFPLVSDTPTEDAPETAKVLIQKIQDAVGNEVTVTAVADSPLKIASVTDGAGRVTTFHYTDGRCDRIQTPWQDAENCIRFKYANGALVKIRHEDNRASEYIYNEEIGYHLLKKAYGADGAFVEYAYTNTGENRVDGLPHCITHATVTGMKNDETLTAANVSYTYGNHMTLVKDEISGKTLRYHFNDDGNQTSVDDELGYAMYTRYDRTDDNANAPINHATERSRMQRVVRNLLLDPMCEENSSVWEKSSTGTITRDQSTRQFGLVSYRLTIWSSDCVYVRQAVTLTPGKSYTLSGYVRSGGPHGVMRVAYTVGNETFTLDSEPGKVWEKTDNMPYERVSVSFTLPENAEPKVYCMAYCDMQDGFAGGNCWFDAMQLEEGLTLNHFNMVQNSDFSVTGTDGKPKAWTVGKNDASNVEVLPLDAPKDEFHAPDCLKHDNTQKIRLAGRYDRTVTYYQQFRHYGKIGDRFTVGGWCSSFAKKNDPDNYIYCRITVQFTSADPVTDKSYWATGGSAVFNAEEGNWQFASAGIVAPNNCTYIRVVLQMNRQMKNAEPKVYCMAYCDMADGFAGGNCWFDAMQLEEGLTLNHFNMVQNSDFSAVGTDGKPKAWTIGSNSNSYVSVLPLDDKDDIFHAPDCLKHDNTQKIRLAGRYDRTVTYYQRFRHYGKIGDRFTVGGWCSSFAKKNDPDNYIYCRITVLFTAGNPDNANCYWATGGSAVFNAEEGNWQFASAGIVAPNNCTYIRVVLQMNRQMNFADFTGIYLYPEAFGTQYIYDKKGNRKTRKMLYGEL